LPPSPLPKRNFAWATCSRVPSPQRVRRPSFQPGNNTAALRFAGCYSEARPCYAESYVPSLSVVIPIHNEEPSILPLYDRLTAVLERLRKPYEIIFIDDASTDRSFDLLANLVETDARLKVIRLRRNFGQTAALAAGFDESQGNIVISLDGDLQHAPEDIPALLEKIDEGYDIASGWRKNRLDNAVTRKFPSRIANWLMAKASHVDLRDFGTTFKAYRAEILKDINLYGELHRFIPALASLYGARIAEVPIRNNPRASGGSHYGLGRTFRVMFDIFTVWFLLKYFTRPMHFFGKWGLISIGAGGGLLAWLGVWKLWTHADIIVEHGPLMIAGGLALVNGVILFCTGLLGEVLTRTYFESQGRRIYAVREIRTRREEKAAGGSRG
jgi:glycosyltransferase involved in cell wall biosynthesis